MISGFTILGTVLYCYFFFQFWTHKETHSFTSLVEFKKEHTRAHLGRQILVHKDFYPVLAMLDSLAKENKVTILVTSSYRKPGQKLSKKVVRPATTSNHLAGHAIDINVKMGFKNFESSDLKKENLNNLPLPVKRFIQAIRKKTQVRWGGDFNTPDPVHIDSPLNKKNPALWRKYHNDCLDDWTKAEFKWKKSLLS